MEYLIIRKRAEAPKNPFTERVSAGNTGTSSEFPFDAETHDLSDRDAQDWRHDPSVEDAVLSMPFTLIEPVAEEAAVAVEVETPWGIEAVGATSSPQTGKGVTVAVLDSGIDLKHPAFSGLTFDQNDLKDFTTKKDGKGVPGAAPDVFGHGTHVAGTIFGGEVDGKRIGVAPGITRALIGKVLKPEGTATHALFHALSWALEERADVICMSLSINFLGMVERLIEKGYPPDVAASRALEGYRSNVRMFDKFADFVKSRTDDERGAMLVAASGNGSRRDINTQFTVAVAPPAAADGFISVGAVARTGDDAAPFKVADFSNTGCSVSAPGVGILSAKLGGGLKFLNGTSTATPHVAGVLALWTEKLFPNGGRPRGWTEDVRLAVLGSLTRTPGQSRGDVGRGIVRAPSAVS